MELNTYQQQVVEFGGGGGGGGITTSAAIAVSGSPTVFEFDLPANTVIIDLVGKLVTISGDPLKIQFGTSAGWFGPVLQFDFGIGNLSNDIPFYNTQVSTSDLLTYNTSFNSITLPSLATKIRFFCSNTSVPSQIFSAGNWRLVYSSSA